MGDDCDDATGETVSSMRARMDDRGRATVKVDDRIALGVNDLDENERALLELKEVEVIAVIDVENEGGDADA